MLFKGPSQWGDMSKFSLGQRMKSSVTGKHPNAGTPPKNSTVYGSENMSDSAHLFHKQNGNRVLPNSERPTPPTSSSAGAPPAPPSVKGTK
jgi:hypothetical protein